MLGMRQQSEAWAAETTEVVIEGLISGNPNERNVPTGRRQEMHLQVGIFIDINRIQLCLDLAS
jgi:hypothetical protein